MPICGTARAIAALIAALVLAGAAAAQPSSTEYQVQRTPWGDPDFRGTWPLQEAADAGVPFERPEDAGERAWQTDEEFAARIHAAELSDAGSGWEGSLAESSEGLAAWVRNHPDGRRTSLIVDPVNGRLPPLTPAGEALLKAGKSSWVNPEDIDWLTDLDAFDRCITRGLPSIMFPVMGNNAVRVFQAPGLVVLKTETLETRMIPIAQGEHPPPSVRSWMGDSRGRWEGNTLVIETTNIVAGDGTGRAPLRLAASPAYQVGPLPVGTGARLIERLTMTGADQILYEATYSDPEVFTAPWTATLTWSRDDNYRMFEYACHEGNTQIRHMINSSRARRQSEEGSP